MWHTTYYPDSLGLGSTLWKGLMNAKNEEWLEFEAQDDEADNWYIHTLSIV
jgi:hypothetical protein